MQTSTLERLALSEKITLEVKKIIYFQINQTYKINLGSGGGVFRSML